MQKGIFIFRAADLNGAASEVILKSATSQRVAEVRECTQDTIDAELERFIENGEYNKYSKTYILGIGFSTHIADKITTIIEEEGAKFIHRAHTRDALNLSKYMWSRVLLFDRNGNPISSAKKLYQELVDSEHKKYVRLSIFIDMVNASITGYVPLEDEEGKKIIEELYTLAGSPTVFEQRMTEKLRSNDAFFNEQDILDRLEVERKAREEEELKKAQMRERLKRPNRSLW